MAVSLISGPILADLERDDEGYRTYTIAHIIKSSTGADGPYTVMGCPGLPVIGDTWNFFTDVDIWAFRYPYMKISRHSGVKEQHPVNYWRVEQKFSNKPLKRCQDTTIDNPLDEPQKLSGSFVKRNKEVFRNNDGSIIQTSSCERLNGPAVEFDDPHPTVKIEQNVINLELPLITSIFNGLNDATLWGVSRRCIHFSEFSWERKLYGTCNYYYTRSFGFNIDFNTFDRYEIDQGTKILKGKWENGVWVVDAGMSRTNPTHFMRYVDQRGEAARCLLDGRGLPATTNVRTASGTSYTGGEPGVISIYPLSSVNLLSLGIPISL